jgi:precorrin-4 methylase
MPDLDQSSAAIGRLQQSAEEQTRQLAEIRRAAESTHALMIEHMAESRARDARTAKLESDMAKIVLPIVAEWNALRHKGIGALVVIGLAVSAISFAIAQFGSKIVSKLAG